MIIDEDYVCKQMNRSWRYGLATGFLIGLIPFLITLYILYGNEI